MTVRGSCHCGAVRIEAPEAPEWVGACNCSLCRKLAWAVAYYTDGAVTVTGETVPYIWGDRLIGIHHCPTCGCGTHWKALGEEQSHQSGPLTGNREKIDRMGVNARLLDGFEADRPGGACFDGKPLEVRPFDNADN